MNSLLRTLFGRPDPPASSFNHSVAPSVMQTDSEAANRHQLVLISVRDVWRRNGIPAGWVECQTLMVTSRRRGSGLYIQLMIRHWDERLLRYACALQTEVVNSISRFDPKAVQWIHGVSWQFPDVSQCPHDTLPDKSFWQPEPAADAKTSEPSAHFPAVLAAVQPPNPAAAPPGTVNFHQTQPLSRDEVALDLEKLFAIRDEELKRTNGDTAPLGGFEQTQPSPLNR